MTNLQITIVVTPDGEVVWSGAGHWPEDEAWEEAAGFVDITENRAAYLTVDLNNMMVTEVYWLPEYVEDE